MQQKIKISCLPVANRYNPYQYLMMQGLAKSDRLQVQHGAPGSIFAFMRTALFQRPDYLHLDWIHRYYLRGAGWKTRLTLPLFYFEIWFISVFTSVKIVWTLHNIHPHGSKQEQKISKNVRRFLAKKATFIRIFNETTLARATAALKIEADKFKIIPEGSYVGYYPDEVRRPDAKKKIGIPSTKKMIVNLGTIRPYKGIEDLIRTFDEINHADWYLCIAGASWDDKYIRTLRHLAQSGATADRILFNIRKIPDEELQYFFNAAELAVFPFRNIENSGSVILAMGFGLPVVTVNAGVPADRLRQQRQLLFTDDLRSVLTKAMKSEAHILSEIGQNNIASVQQYKWEDYVSAFV